MRTATPISHGAIMRLQSEAIAARDWPMSEICAVALVTGCAEQTWSAGGRAWTPDEARAECARVIAARAQESGR